MEKNEAAIPVYNHVTKHGVEIRIDPRFVCLAAALTASSERVSNEHPLVTDTRQYLREFAAHPSVTWLAEMDQKYIILGLCMQTAQMGSPPEFTPSEQGSIPEFVKEVFSNPPVSDMAKHLRILWYESHLESLIKKQQSMWNTVVKDMAAFIEDIDLIAFQKKFYGEYPYQPVIIPLASLAPSRIGGAGTANDKEAYAICLLSGSSSYKEQETWRILELAQHEASHPIIDKIWRMYPDVPLECGHFVEEIHPPEKWFAHIYDDVNSRFVESLIQASSWFFIREERGDKEANNFLQMVIKHTGESMNVYIEALKPWWELRKAGKAAGLNELFHQLPEWVKKAQKQSGSM